mmetsp:Transcript_142635/g.248722  ORF Transcript_142635/g.248722 Transcript_142635/m.248722 type:complete len:204 (-) Transcript_142635:983-1594(-)
MLETDTKTHGTIQTLRRKRRRLPQRRKQRQSRPDGNLRCSPVTSPPLQRVRRASLRQSCMRRPLLRGIQRLQQRMRKRKDLQHKRLGQLQELPAPAQQALQLLPGLLLLEAPLLMQQLQPAAWQQRRPGRPHRQLRLRRQPHRQLQLGRSHRQLQPGRPHQQVPLRRPRLRHLPQQVSYLLHQQILQLPSHHCHRLHLHRGPQ